MAAVDVAGPVLPPAGLPNGAGPQVISIGALTAAPLKTVMEAAKEASHESQAAPMVSALAGHIRTCWTYARDAKMQLIEPRMLASVRARRGEYEPEKLAQIRDQGGSEVYPMLTSTKCRAAGSWLRDVLMGQGSEKPWTLRPTRDPQLPAGVADKIVESAVGPIQQAIEAGMPMPQDKVVELMTMLRDAALEEEREEARQRMERAEAKIEDILQEGGWMEALDAFIDDVTTFPTAWLKGPVVRKKPALTWVAGADGTYTAQVTEQLKPCFDRVDPFMVYPSPQMSTVDDGYLIEKHRMSRQDLQDLIGVEGYDSDTIRVVIDQFGKGGLREWLTNDVAQASAQGKATTSITQNPDSLIDALQFWGSVSGKHLLDWGLDRKQVPDPTKEYHIEAWLISNYVIKATLNYDPLRRKPYYCASYEQIPGSIWGNSVADLVRDSQTVCGSTARGIVNNTGIASGPQVVVNVDRLAQGEDISQLYPWRIWQATTDALGNNAPPVTFYQPDSRVGELMNVFQFFSQQADETSGIPKYMGGDAGGQAGRTASGLSMLMSNAGKSIKQVVGNVDVGVLTPLLERTYDWCMRYSPDPDLKGDANVVARGANSLIAKDAMQVRRNEFLAQTANPVDMQIVGLSGRAMLLREAAKNLGMDVDKIVPTAEQLAVKQAMAAWKQAQAAPPPGAPGGMPGQPGQPAPVGSGQPGLPGQPPPDQMPALGSAPAPVANGQVLQDGSPITDLHAPTPK